METQFDLHNFWEEKNAVAYRLGPVKPSTANGAYVAAANAKYEKHGTQNYGRNYQ